MIEPDRHVALGRVAELGDRALTRAVYDTVRRNIIATHTGNECQFKPFANRDYYRVRRSVSDARQAYGKQRLNRVGLNGIPPI